MNDKRITPNEGTWWAMMGALILVVVVVRIVWATYVFDDWTCAFAKCAKVELVK